MRTTLLRRLRRKANKEYYVRVSTILPDHAAYDIMRREPLADYCLNTVWNSYADAENILRRYIRQYIKNQVNELRFTRFR